MNDHETQTQTDGTTNQSLNEQQQWESDKTVQLPPISQTKSQPLAITADRLDAISKRLDALPACQIWTTQTAIDKLMPSISKMLGRGYSVEQVAAELAATGLAVSSRTLARSLAKNKATAKAKKARPS